MIWLLLPLALAADPARVEEERRVAEAAAAVAQARRDGARASKIAALMAVYRQEAERLAALDTGRDLDAEARGHAEALRALGEATATARADTPARAVVEGWLGPLGARLDVLDRALGAAATSPSDLARSMAADVEAQAVAVLLVAAYDASRADAEGREARARAAGLRAAASPLERPDLSTELEMRRLDELAEAAAARAAELRALGERAAALRDRAAAMGGHG